MTDHAVGHRELWGLSHSGMVAEPGLTQCTAAAHASGRGQGALGSPTHPPPSAPGFAHLALPSFLPLWPEPCLSSSWPSAAQPSLGHSVAHPPDIPLITLLSHHRSDSVARAGSGGSRDQDLQVLPRSPCSPRAQGGRVGGDRSGRNAGEGGGGGGAPLPPEGGGQGAQKTLRN